VQKAEARTMKGKFRKEVLTEGKICWSDGRVANEPRKRPAMSGELPEGLERSEIVYLEAE